ncbi:glycosyl transferase family 39 [Thiorhodococcus drewsii AZ1]|uniref:Glycosyl transferase family 39 n=1 Tax=Thiorhodococcus drewsii AZ1 TaxID=765913 RepID=G2E5G2_9GAMM|nr:glycosyltransferase family 39 protein [Thiorhodococcus drewsii]EGV28747.1 glycosyl transferase family 39 [Thiorhodococcus drewsii AZ1]
MERPPASTSVAGRATASTPGVVFYVVVALVVLAATAVRLFGLDHLLVWHDEVFTLIRVFGYTPSEIQAHLFSGTLLTPADLLRYQMPDPGHGWADTMAAFASHPEHAPLYYILARLATDLPVEPIVAARGVSALFGVLLVPSTYWLMRELFGRGPAPWIAALLVACSPLDLLYAQEARQYALWMCMILVSSAVLARALRDDRQGLWWLYGITITLGCYSHLLFVLMIPVHALFALISHAEHRRSFPDFKRLAVRWSIAILGAMVAFSPWLLVFLIGRDQVDQFTAWMLRPIGLSDILSAWAGHLSSAFVDLSPEAEPWWGLILIPLVWVLWRFLLRAPRGGMWFLVATFGVYVAIVLGPDLLLGGSRSLHVRYVLPAILAIQLMVAWVLGGLVAAPVGTPARTTGILLLVSLVVLGGLSELQIMRASSWSNKNFSARNLEVAQVANADARTLVLASDNRSGVSSGELISLAYHLAPQVRIWGESRGGTPVIPSGFGRVIALTPTEALLALLKRQGRLVPLAGTWQWLIVEPAAEPVNEGEGEKADRPEDD